MGADPLNGRTLHTLHLQYNTSKWVFFSSTWLSKFSFSSNHWRAQYRDVLHPLPSQRFVGETVHVSVDSLHTSG